MLLYKVISLHKNGQINITSTNKYLGVQLDSSLNLNSDFDAKYKKASGRLRLLAKIRNHLDTESVKAIYRSVVIIIIIMIIIIIIILIIIIIIVIMETCMINSNLNTYNLKIR